MGAAQSAGRLPETPETERPLSLGSPDSPEEQRPPMNRYENKRPTRLLAFFEDTTNSMLFEHFNSDTPPGLLGPPLSPLGPNGQDQGLLRSTTVNRSLDSRFRRAALFQRAAAGFPHIDVTADQVGRHFLWLNQHRENEGGPVALLKRWMWALQKDPWLRVIVVVTGLSGGVVCIIPGATAGICAGAAAGFAVGLVPAPLTLGLSIPASTITGGVVGGVLGGSATSGMGCVSSAAIAASLWEKQGDVRHCVYDGYHILSTKAGVLGVYTKEQLFSVLSSSRSFSTMFAVSAKTKAKKLAKDQVAQCAALGAAGGSATLGAGGGAMGFLVGSATGAAWGVVPALFTFGLSIPVGAMVVGTAGLFAGATAGGTVGFWGGGLLGASFGVLAGDSTPEPPRMRKSSSEVTLRELSSSSSLAAMDEGGQLQRRPSLNNSRNTLAGSSSGSACGSGDPNPNVAP